MSKSKSKKTAVQVAADDHVRDTLGCIYALTDSGHELRRLCRVADPDYDNVVKRLNKADTTGGDDVGALMAATEDAAFALGLAVGKRIR